MKRLDPLVLRADSTASTAAPTVHVNLPWRKVTLLLVSALTIMSGATIAPSLPAIEAHFAATENAALLTRFVLTMPALLIALCAPLAGSLADRYGRRRLLIGATLLYGFAGMSGLLLGTLHGLLVGRALLGMAVAGTMTTATALVGDYFAGPERDRFMGLQAAFIGFGGLVFLTGGGVLAEFHWRAPFAVYGLALVLLPAIILYISEPSRLAPGSMSAMNQPAVGHPRTAIAALFAIAALNSVVFYLVPTQLPFYLQTLGTEAPSQAGLAIGLFNVTMAAMSLAYGRTRHRVGIMGMFGVGFGFMAAGYGLVAAAGSYPAILAAMAVTGIGMGAIMPNLMASALTIAPPALRGRVAGGLTASIFVGQFLSPLVSQPWIESFGFAAAFRDMGLLLAAVAVGAGLLAAGSRRAASPVSTSPRS
ncbi:MFS transporter [Rhodospirillaceae bacterium SYSU D60014]|uniref:MFS transporter n=1 Tax=Virgifigura deserti TaxID=2268457 RepID=UPI000E662A46